MKFFILFLIFVILYLYINKNYENFFVIGAGTRTCNNRDCDILNRYSSQKS